MRSISSIALATTSISSIALATTVLGCSDGSDGSENVVRSSSNLYVAADRELWSADEGSIPVCWLNHWYWANEFPEEMEWVRDAIERSWGYYGNIRFSWGGECSAQDLCAVRIALDDTSPGTSGGMGMDAICNADWNVRFNFWYEEFDREYCNAAVAGEQAREECIRAHAIHEFGHILGFAHENNRPDTPEWCEEHGGDGTETFGAWDLNSAMNGCNPIWENAGRGLRLSSTDVAGLIKYYGANPKMTVASWTTVSPVR